MASYHRNESDPTRWRLPATIVTGMHRDTAAPTEGLRTDSREIADDGWSIPAFARDGRALILVLRRATRKGLTIRAYAREVKRTRQKSTTQGKNWLILHLQ